MVDWLGVGEMGLFNFKPSVRSVPLEVDVVFFVEVYLSTEMMSISFLFFLKKSISLEIEDY